MLAKGNLKAPACQTCHTPHGIQRAESSNWQLGVINQCGNCHSDRIATFRDTFHGQVTSLGSRQVAGCADCHGPHEVLPASDPRSMTAPANLVATCGKCHENATANFVKYDPHADKHDRQRSPALYYTYQFMSLLLVGVFGFYGVHTTLWFAKEIRVRRERRAKAARLVAVKKREPLAPVKDTKETGNDDAK
jgi:bacterioferritin-associated ferredoxin